MLSDPAVSLTFSSIETTTYSFLIMTSKSQLSEIIFEITSYYNENGYATSPTTSLSAPSGRALNLAKVGRNKYIAFLEIETELRYESSVIYSATNTNSKDVVGVELATPISNIFVNYELT